MPLNEQQIQALWDAWLKILKQAACEKLKSSAAGFARLGSSDEDIYTCLVALTDMYRHVVNLCGTIELQNPEAETLLQGICEVLSARLKEFDDTRAFACEVNPVLQEKCGIIYQSLFLMYAEIENPDNVSSTLQKHMQLCISQLDDLHTRTNTRLCIETLEREWEELGNIIKLQVAALEAALEEDDEAVFFILNILRELYQRTAPIIEHIQMLLTSPPVQNELAFSFDLADFNGDFIALLANAADHIFISLQPNKDDPKNNAMAKQSKDANLADEILAAFTSLRNALPDITEETAKPDIVKGILETLDIKIESLQDSIELFGQEGESVIQAFADTNLTPSAKEISVAAEAMFTAWVNDPPTGCGIHSFFDDMANGNIFAAFTLRGQKQTTAFEEKFDRFLLRFKKEVLLYEICTYEEILTHSVSVLTQDTDAFHHTFTELQAILERNAIVPIRPAEHEPFNAFEHDVLVAEEHEGFKKGEIIKCLTTGYKQHDKVIIRANVIAGR